MYCPCLFVIGCHYVFYLCRSESVQVFFLACIHILPFEIQLSRGVGIPLTRLTLPHYCACSKPTPGFPTHMFYWYWWIYYYHLKLSFHSITEKFKIMSIKVKGIYYKCSVLVMIFQLSLMLFTFVLILFYSLINIRPVIHIMTIIINQKINYLLKYDEFVKWLLYYRTEIVSRLNNLNFDFIPLSDQLTDKNKKKMR